ncbi:MAG TPA: FGGY-family carbohydrate kinase [Roseiarcus sp.]
MNATLGIDIGTYQSKGVLVDADGRVLASAARPHELIVPRAGWAEHRADEDWWADFVWLSQKLLADSGLHASDVKAVGASAIGPCMLPVDADGAPLMNAVLYGVDTRASREIEDLTAGIGAARILSFGGNALTSQAVGPKILWLKRNRPDIYAKARKFLNSTSFLVNRLTGRFVADHYSASSVAPLYDIEQRTWSDALGPDITELERLPEIAWTTEIAGTVTHWAAEQTGLAFGTPVIVGTIDAAAEAISVGVLDPGELMLMYGSTIFTIRIGSERIRDPRLWHAPWLFPDQYASMAGLATSGTLTHWFADQLARDVSPEAAMAALAAEAATSRPGANGLVFLPYFSGERTPIHDPNAKGAIVGLTLAHTRADIYRAALEGIAFATNHIFDTYAEAGAPPSTIVVVGGGLRNRIWTQATSDISGLRQQARKVSIGASYGDAFLARLALGDVSKSAIKQWNPAAFLIEADPRNARAYEKLYATFRALYPRMRDIMADLGPDSERELR